MPSYLERILKNAAGAFDGLLDDLRALVAIPSVSGVEAHREDSRRAAAWIKDRLAALPLERIELFATSRNPIIFAQGPARDPRAPTVLL